MNNYKLMIVAFDWSDEPTRGTLPNAMALWSETQNPAPTYHLFGELDVSSTPPGFYDPDTVVFTDSGVRSAHAIQALGWPMPRNFVDLYAERRVLENGLIGDGPPDDVATRFNGASSAEFLKSLMVCVIENFTEVGEDALRRGRQAFTVAAMERRGIPVDVQLYEEMQRAWPRIIERAATSMSMPVFRAGKFDAFGAATLLGEAGVQVPLGDLDMPLIEGDWLSHLAQRRPDLEETAQALKLFMKPGLRLPQLSADGRARTQMRPYWTTTGRFNPRSSEYLLSLPRIVRNLIAPPEGRAIVIADIRAADFAAGAAIANDPVMIQDYVSGDAYMAFAASVCELPDDVEPSAALRAMFKEIVLAVMYGAGATNKSRELGLTVETMNWLIDTHRQRYQIYWRWRKSILASARQAGVVSTKSGWRMQVLEGLGDPSLACFPLQASVADLLHDVLLQLADLGVGVIGTNHDSVLVEVAADEVDASSTLLQKVFRTAGERVFGVSWLHTKVEAVVSPRYWEQSKTSTVWTALVKAAGEEVVSK